MIDMPPAYVLITLLVYTSAVYGVSWILSMSSLFEPLREKLSDVPVLGTLLQCIVCTSVWVGLLIGLLAPYTRGLFRTFLISNGADALLWAGWCAAWTWAIALKLGDAE